MRRAKLASKTAVYIKETQSEQTLFCYGLRGAPQGLIEQDCDGPCKDALQMLDKHLNQGSHRPDLREKPFFRSL